MRYIKESFQKYIDEYGTSTRTESLLNLHYRKFRIFMLYWEEKRQSLRLKQRDYNVAFRRTLLYKGRSFPQTTSATVPYQKVSYFKNLQTCLDSMKTSQKIYISYIPSLSSQAIATTTKTFFKFTIFSGTGWPTMFIMRWSLG